MSGMIKDTAISGDRLNEERAFIKRYTEGLASTKVEYPADYSTPLESRPRKVAVVGIEVPPPPEVGVDAGPSQSATLNLTIKSLKPSLTVPVSVHITDTIAQLKELVAKSSATAPTVESQRLLYKGKALNDGKLVKEYEIPEGSTVILMVKAAPPAAAAAPAAPAPAEGPMAPTPSATTVSATSPTTSKRETSAPPSLTISTTTDSKPQPVTDMDIDVPPSGPQPQISSASFHKTLADPTFWQRIHALCVSEFEFEDDADTAWEIFLLSMKSRLSAGEAAKICDVVGVNGMGGGA